MDALDSEEREALAILAADWGDLLRCTTIDQAMERLGLSFSHSSRLRIATHLREHSGEFEGMRWPISTYVLTNAERLVARRLLRGRRAGEDIPPPEEGAAAFRISRETAQTAYDALGWLGFLADNDHRWKLADDLKPFLAGLGLHFHEVALPERAERFNTNCALDFFIMTHPRTRKRALVQLRKGRVPELSGEGMSPGMIAALDRLAGESVDRLIARGFYESEPAILSDACGWSDEAIRVVMEGGKCLQVTPESAWYLRGGG